MAPRAHPSQQIVAENLARILRARSLDAQSAAKLLHCKTYQVNRLLAAEHAITVRTLDILATAFGLEPYQLLVPGLNPDNPQILRVLSPAEERLYQALQEARDNTAK